jgi:hypothetical protein
MAATLTENEPYHNATIDGEAPKYLIRRTYRRAEPDSLGGHAYLDPLDAIKAALASPRGQTAVRDLAKFADGGAELYFFDTKDVRGRRNSGTDLGRRRVRGVLAHCEDGIG